MSKYEICSGCGNKRYIVNRKHMMCLSCNKNRIEEEKMKNKGVYTHSKPLKTEKKVKRPYIRPASSKLVNDRQKYEKVKREKKANMIEGKYYKCFFSNKPLDPSFTYGWHHVLGRKGKLLYDYKNIFPAIDYYHQSYHHWSIARLVKEQWYIDFVKRLDKHNCKGYNQEMRRWWKAKIIDDSEYFSRIKDCVN